MPSSSMTGPQQTPPTMAEKARTTVSKLFVGGVVGGAVGYLGAKYLIGGKPHLFAGDEFASLLIALMLVAMAAFTAWVASSPARFKKHYEKRDDAEPADAMAMAAARGSTWVVALAGVMLATPPVVAVLTPDPTWRTIGAIVLAVMLALQSWGNWRMWRDGDELTRAVIVSTGALCFWTLQLGLFAWAALAKLALVPDIGSWTMITVLMAVYVIASVVVSVRRGYANV